MTDTEPGGAAPGPEGPPARPPGPAPAGYVRREWFEQAPPVAPPPMPPPMPPDDPTFTFRTSPPSALPIGDAPFLDTPWVPPQTKRQGGVWLFYAVIGFVVGQLGALIFGYVAGVVAGKSSAQMTAIASAAVPPEWYVVTTLLGLWIGFVGAPWLASRTQGTRHFFRDLGVRFRLLDLVGIAIGVGGQILVAVMYAPFQHDIKNFNAPSQRLTGASHGAGFVVIAVATVLVAPAMEELFFRACSSSRWSDCSRRSGQPAALEPPESSWP